MIVRVGSRQVGSVAGLQRALRMQANHQHRVTLDIVRNREERQMSVLLNPHRPNHQPYEVKPLPIMSLRIK